MLDELCRCGSGRLHGACHGLRGRLRRGRGRELHALAEVHAVGVFFPALRPQGDAFAAYAVADELRAAIGVAELLLDGYELQLDERASYISRAN